MGSPPTTLIYIAGSGHSGSTMLDLIIGSHSETVSVGEAKRLDRHISTGRREMKSLEEIRCTCGADSILVCDYWREVESVLSRRNGLRLAELSLESRDAQTFRAHNLALFSAVSDVSSRRYVVDSSKNLGRLLRLVAMRAFDVRPILLLREPEGYVYSQIRKRRSWPLAACSYTRDVLAFRAKLKRHRHFVQWYESLAAAPEACVERLMTWIGLGFEPDQLSWRKQPQHNIGGNRMRLSGDDRISLDDAWQYRLAEGQKRGISILTLPTRLGRRGCLDGPRDPVGRSG
jgi:hypothetical protein